ncbi:NAD(P)/FAD-dependent oxidoreductase [Phascolarctobacterium sp.]|uniref:NAD(P)/FAD-dependent oxidoreductase n=2 Tax=Phascolarctobacterium sp. TaxID=2049039 RepID=UPI00386713C1
MSKVVIIGAGAAGLLAGITAAQNGADVTILEKMRQPGKKMLITGKGRCNITNACEIPEFIKNLPGNGRFLNSALHRFTNDDIVIMLESNGLQTKVERGNRVFPVSDKAKDVVDTLTKIYTQAGGKLLTDTKALEILIKDGRAVGVKTINGVYPADAVILCAGGASYPGTGSDGGGAKLAAKAGHSIVPLKPSLVPLTSDYPYVDDLQGLSLRNVEATLFADGKKIASEFGEMLFTHFGVSGPIILSLSNAASKAIADGKEVELSLDLKPALSREKLDARIQRDFKEYSRKQLANGMKDLLPQRLIPVVCDMAYLDEEKFINQISREERLRLLDTLKGFMIPITGTRPLAEAIVTAGGVDVKEINPKTMESKLVPGLYFAGEVMDVDGYTGGFNLQAAFSSGYAAGLAAANLE